MRDGDFDGQLHERLERAEWKKRDAIAFAEAKLAQELQGAAAIALAAAVTVAGAVGGLIAVKRLVDT